MAMWPGGGNERPLPLVKPLEEVTPDRMTLENSAPGERADYFYVSRRDGSYSYFLAWPYHDENGHCEVGELTGFPAEKF